MRTKAETTKDEYWLKDVKVKFIGFRILICTKGVGDHHWGHPNLWRRNFIRNYQEQQYGVTFYMVYICAVGFVHHSDEAVHFILIFVLLFPSCQLWVSKPSDQSAFSEMCQGIPSDRSLFSEMCQVIIWRIAPHTWVVHVAGFRDNNKVLSHLMGNEGILHI